MKQADVNHTPLTDAEAFDYRPNQFGGSSFRTTPYGLLVEAKFARQLEIKLNQKNILIDELKEEGDWKVLQQYSGFEFSDENPKTIARSEYENMMYLERPGCNLCMGNQEKAEDGDTVMATSTRLFKGRVVADSQNKKGESLLASTPVVALSSILGRIPSLEEYKKAVEGIDLTKYSPPSSNLFSN